jgi:hypothetical protein
MVVRKQRKAKADISIWLMLSNNGNIQSDFFNKKKKRYTLLPEELQESVNSQQLIRKR